MREGLYDLLLTRQMRDRVAQLSGLTAQRQAVEVPDRADRLARFLAEHARRLLGDHDSSAGTDSALARIVNELIEELSRRLGVEDQTDSVSSPEELLLAIHRGPDPPTRPLTPLSLSTLLARPGKPDLGQELGRELMSADRVDALVSFVTWTGFRRLRRVLEDHAAAGRPLRLITTTYTGATEAVAVREIARLPGAQVRVSFDAGAVAFTPRRGCSTARPASVRFGSTAPIFPGLHWPKASCA